MKRILRILLALPPFLFILCAIIYITDVGGARQVMIDAYTGAVKRVVTPLIDDLGDRADDNLREQQEQRERGLSPVPSPSLPVP